MPEATCLSITFQVSRVLSSLKICWRFFGTCWDRWRRVRLGGSGCDVTDWKCKDAARGQRQCLCSEDVGCRRLLVNVYWARVSSRVMMPGSILSRSRRRQTLVPCPVIEKAKTQFLLAETSLYRVRWLKDCIAGNGRSRPPKKAAPRARSLSRDSGMTSGMLMPFHTTPYRATTGHPRSTVLD